MRQKIKVVLFLITVAGYSLAANAGYIGDSEDWKDWSYSYDHDGGDWFADFGQGKNTKGNFGKHWSQYKGNFFDDIKWGFFHDKGFDIRHIDFKWLDVDDHWFHVLLERFGWIFDGKGPHARVPEPASLILLAVGLLMIAGIRKTR